MITPTSWIVLKTKINQRNNSNSNLQHGWDLKGRKWLSTLLSKRNKYERISLIRIKRYVVTLIKQYLLGDWTTKLRKSCSKRLSRCMGKLKGAHWSKTNLKNHGATPSSSTTKNETPRSHTAEATGWKSTAYTSSSIESLHAQIAIGYRDVLVVAKVILAEVRSLKSISSKR